MTRLLTSRWIALPLLTTRWIRSSANVTRDTPIKRPRRRLDPATRRQELLDVAGDLILAEDCDGTTMDAVAVAAGVNKALLYHYFGSRDGLLVAVQARAFDRLRAEIRSALDAVDDPWDRVRVLVRRWLEPSVHGRLVQAINDAAAGSTELEAVRLRQSFETGMDIAHLLRRCVEVTEPDSVAVAGIFVGGIPGFVIAWRLNGWSLDEAVDRYVVMCGGALRALASDHP